MAPSLNIKIIFMICFSSVVAVNMAGNGLVCFILLQKRARRTSISRLLFHLAIADILVAFSLITSFVVAYIVDHPQGPSGDWLCRFVTGRAFAWIGATASSFLLVIVAFERFYATLHPLQKFHRPLYLVPALWILAVLLHIPYFMRSAYDAREVQCLVKFVDHQASRTYFLCRTFLSSVVPICIVSYLYIRVVMCLWFQRSVVPGSSQQFTLRSRNKVTKMLVTVTDIFIICWTPPSVLCTLGSVLMVNNIH